MFILAVSGKVYDKISCIKWKVGFLNFGKSCSEGFSVPSHLWLFKGPVGTKEQTKVVCWEKSLCASFRKPTPHLGIRLRVPHSLTHISFTTNFRNPVNTRWFYLGIWACCLIFLQELCRPTHVAWFFKDQLSYD